MAGYSLLRARLGAFSDMTDDQIASLFSPDFASGGSFGIPVQTQWSALPVSSAGVAADNGTGGQVGYVAVLGGTGAAALASDAASAFGNANASYATLAAGVAHDGIITEHDVAPLVDGIAFDGVITEYVVVPASSGIAFDGVVDEYADAATSSAGNVVLSDVSGQPIDGTADANSRFDIVINYSGDPAYASYFEAARVRWEQIITGDIADSSYNGIFVDDLMIDASVVYIDGPGDGTRNILGSAGPDWVRSSSILPIHGTMRFDSYDIAQMASSGILDEVILHEMGHVLGIGSIWTSLGLRTGDSSYYGFTGANALAEYRMLSGNTAATSVPVHPGTLSGSSGSHWAEAVFQNELMTPTTGPGTYMPISRMTIASLRDLGYSVNLDAADSYTFTGGGAVAGSVAINDAVIAEGDSGTSVISFSVTRSGGGAAFNVNFSTANGSATAGVDYVGNSGTLSFASGQNTRSLAFVVNGDLAVEGNETFFVNLSGATNGASITDSQGVGTIVDDDTPLAPIIISNGGGDTAAISVTERSVIVTQTTAIDPNPGTAITYSISGGADFARFAINSSNGALSFVVGPDFEAPADSDFNNSYIVQVRASDGMLFDTQTITVNVTNIDESYKRASDFDGDFHSDILWQASNGTPGVWLINGTSIAATGPALANPGSAWHEIDSGDFNNDGKADVLWQHENGASAVWLMNGVNASSMGPALLNPDPAWHAKAAADFDGDGKSDILWQHENGTPAVWLMDGVNLKQGGAALPNPGPSWHVVDAADFNGDGKADILWQNDNGTPAVWLMNGTAVAQTGPALLNPGAGWHAVAAQDFDGDRKADILWQHDNGTPAVWLMNGTSISQTGAALPNPGAGWHVAGAGDYSGAKAGIMWQHDNGTPAIWLLDGTVLAQTSPPLINPGAGWHIV